MAAQEYLVSYGVAGEIGRFTTDAPISYGRGDRVVIRSRRGVEIGTVLCPADPAAVPDAIPTGQLLHRAGDDDDRQFAQQLERARDAFDQARSLAEQLGLPIEIIDVEAICKPSQLVLHYLGEADCRPLVSTLAKRFDAYVELCRLAMEPAGGCGRCGSGQGCGSCSAGGCSSCSNDSSPTDRETSDEGWTEYLLQLRSRMQANQPLP